jgi:hypothetical protein
MGKVHLLPVKRLEEAAECRSTALDMLRSIKARGLQGNLNEYMQLRAARQMIAAAREVHGVWLQEQLAQGRLAYLEERRKGAYMGRREREEKFVLAREKNAVAMEAVTLRREELALRRKGLKLKERAIGLRVEEMERPQIEREEERARRKLESEATIARLRGSETIVASAQSGLAEDARVPGAGLGTSALDAAPAGDDDCVGGLATEAGLPRTRCLTDPWAPPEVDPCAGRVGGDDGDGRADAESDRPAE